MNVTNKEQLLVRKMTEIKTITYTDLNMKQILTNTGNLNYFKFVIALKNTTYPLDIKYASHIYLPVLGRGLTLFSAN